MKETKNKTEKPTEATQTQHPAEKKKRLNRTMEAARRLRGHLIVNDPKFLV
jgi:hypothetical protein